MQVNWSLRGAFWRMLGTIIYASLVENIPWGLCYVTQASALDNPSMGKCWWNIIRVLVSTGNYQCLYCPVQSKINNQAIQLMTIIQTLVCWILIFVVCILLCVTSISLCNASVNTTRKILQLKSISHRWNFIVYRYMFRSSWNHHQAVYIIYTIKLIEISIWIHVVVQRVYNVKVVENCALCYDENL
jgi:hypothetical protein